MLSSLQSYSPPINLMPRSRMVKYAYACLTGMMLGFAFPPMQLGILSFFALIPLLLVIESECSKEHGSNLRFLYVTYFLYQGIANWWVGSWQKESDPFLMIAGLALQFGHPFFLMIPFLAVVYIRKRIPSPIVYLALPVLYVSYEWLHSLTDASYPWLSLGYMSLSMPVIAQFADLFGVMGVSFLLVFVQSVIFVMLINDDKRFRLIGIPILLLVLTSSILYGNHRIHQMNVLVSEAPTINVGIVQPNINPWNKWQSEVRDQIFIHKQTMQSIAGQTPDLWIWSETAIPFVNVSLNVMKDFSTLQSIIGHIPVLTGFAHLELIDHPELEPLSKPFSLIPGAHYVAYNAAALVQDSSVQVHKKMRLTPFGEGFPFSQDIPLLGSILQWGVGISGWKKGATQHNAVLMKHGKPFASIGIVICIESIYPDFVRNYAKEGATMLSVITNDAWFDNSPGPMQHFAISQMRAIENRRAIARCGNTGVSGIILPDGSISLMAPPQQRTTVYGKVPQLTVYSIYSRIGDLFPMCASALSFGIVCFAGYAGRVRRERS